MTRMDGPLLNPIVIDPGRLTFHGEDLRRELPNLRDDAACDLEERLAEIQQGRWIITAHQAEDWYRTMCNVIDKLLAGRPFALHTPAECCALTTILEEADVDLAYCMEFELPDVVLPECVAPLCAFADYDEFYIDDDDEDEDPEDRPPIRHPMRNWRVTVTLEQQIDRTDHPCDPDVCPLEVTFRKRVTFKTILARTRHHAEDRALDLFEITHKVREGAEYGAEAVLIEERTGRETSDPIAPAETKGLGGTP